jgi:DNA-binding beta-propeller fold protein YncE
MRVLYKNVVAPAFAAVLLAALSLAACGRDSSPTLGEAPSQPASDRSPSSAPRQVEILHGQFRDPQGVAIGRDGSIYVTDGLPKGAIYRVPPRCTVRACVESIGSYLGSPYGIAIALNNDVYVADSFHSVVNRFSKQGATWTSIQIGDFAGSSPAGLALDAVGNVYVGITAPGDLEKVAPPFVGPRHGTPTMISTKLQGTIGVALDAARNIYVANNYIDFTNNTVIMTVLELSPSGKTLRTIDLGSNDNPNRKASLSGVAIDSAGDIYAADDAHHTVWKVTPLGTTSKIGRGFFAPAGVALDPNCKGSTCDVYVADDARYSQAIGMVWRVSQK